MITAKAPNKDDLKRIYLATKVVGRSHLSEARVGPDPAEHTSPSAHVGFEFNKGTTACGGLGRLVQRTAGDMLIVYDFEGGGGDPVLTLRRWVTSGACEVGSSSAPCWGTGDKPDRGRIRRGEVNTGSRC